MKNIFKMTLSASLVLAIFLVFGGLVCAQTPPSTYYSADAVPGTNTTGGRTGNINPIGSDGNPGKPVPGDVTDPIHTTGTPTTGNSEHTTAPPKEVVPTLTNPLDPRINSAGALVQKFVEIFSYFVVILAVLALIYLGFKYVLYAAQGNSNGIKDLHGWLLWIIVGTAIVIGARVMIEVVLNTIEATGTVNQRVINTAKNAAKGN